MIELVIQSKQGLEVTYLPGGLNYGKMSGAMRFVMRKVWAPSMRKKEGDDFHNQIVNSYDNTGLAHADSFSDRILSEIG